MTTTENSLLYFENGQSFVAMTALTDSGDHKVYNSAAELWSDESGFSPVVKPDGILTGLVVTPAISGSNDKVDISAGTLNLAGVAIPLLASADNTCLRGSGADIRRINSITITSAGAVAVLSGLAHTAFSEVRGANGGPPYIPVGSVELAQVRFSSTASAPIISTEIYAVPNLHRETAHYPSILKTEFIREQDTVLGLAGVTFSTALMLNHTGNVTKKVYAQFYEPEFSELPRSSDFKPAANSISITSQPYYGGATGEVNTALKAGKFKAFLDNGISDPILRKEKKKIWIKYFVDRLQPDNYILTQGTLGVDVQYPARGSIFSDFTINANDPGNRITG